MKTHTLVVTKELREKLFSTAPIRWMELEGCEYEDQVDVLVQWLTWLTSRYGLDHRSVPRCWQEHGALIEELSALRISWSKAYCTPPEKSTYTPLHWHIDFAASRRRLAEWVARTGCRPDEHRSDP